MERSSLKGEIYKKYKDNNTKYTEKELLKLIYDVLQGLLQLKKLGISHRNISPDNILIDALGNYRLSDIGVGKSLALLSTVHDMSSKTVKPKYMAPEIMNFKDEVNWNAADVYSFMKVILDAA